MKFVYCINQRILGYASMCLMTLNLHSAVTESNIEREIERLDKFEQSLTESIDSADEFDPSNAVIESKDGQILFVKILGYDSNSLSFYSKKHKADYTVPLDSLDPFTVENIKANVPKKFLHLNSSWQDFNKQGKEQNYVTDLAYALGLSISLARDAQEAIGGPGVAYLTEDYEQLDFSGDKEGETTYIYGGISYLMDLEDAEAELSEAIESGTSRSIDAPGFPKNSFTQRKYLISHEYRQARDPDDLSKLSGYNTISLILDSKRQVVAVQLDRTTSIKIKDTRGFHRSVYNFIDPKISGSDSARISSSRNLGGRHVWIPELELNYLAASMPKGSNTHRITTELYGSSGEVKSHHRLLIPEKVAKIISYNLRTNWLPNEGLLEQFDQMDKEARTSIRKSLESKLKSFESNAPHKPY